MDTLLFGFKYKDESHLFDINTVSSASVEVVDGIANLNIEIDSRSITILCELHEANYILENLAMTAGAVFLNIDSDRDASTKD